MTKKHKPRGRHAVGVSEGRYPEDLIPVPTHPRIVMKPGAAEEEKITQFVLFGEPGSVPETRGFRVPLSEAHPESERTGTIAAVALQVHGDGSAMLQIWGYDLADAQAQWKLAAGTLGSFKISAFPALAEISDQVICAHCGGELHLDDPTCSDDWVHIDGNVPCAPRSGYGAQPVRLIETTTTPAPGIPMPTSWTPSEPVLQSFPPSANGTQIPPDLGRLL